MSNRARGTRDNGVLVCGIGQVLFPCTTRRVDNCEKINKVLTFFKVSLAGFASSTRIVYLCPFITMKCFVQPTCELHSTV